jgi:pre-mRNA-processing factor 40
MKVLRQMKVQPDWTWQQAVRAGIHDPNWRAIPEPEKREEAFRKYCEDMRAQEKHKEQDRQAKLRSDFTAMLRSHPEIKYYTRWKTALPIIEEETIFRSAKDDTERRSLFEEYIISLKKAHEEEEAESRRSALDEVMGLLKGLDLEPFTRWQAAEEKLELNDEFNSEKFEALTRMDVLNQFEKHIRQLQREHNDKVQAERRKKHRVERKNRDAFLELLDDLRDSGLLRAGTKWKGIHDTIKDDPRYTAMLGQSGSSPLDLFRDALEEEEGKFRTLRRRALDVLEVRRYPTYCLISSNCAISNNASRLPRRPLWKTSLTLCEKILAPLILTNSLCIVSTTTSLLRSRNARRRNVETKNTTSAPLWTNFALPSSTLIRQCRFQTPGKWYVPALKRQTSIAH